MACNIVTRIRGNVVKIPSSVWALRKWFIMKTRVSLNGVQLVFGEKETAGSRAFWILLTQDTTPEAESHRRWLGGRAKWKRS